MKKILLSMLLALTMICNLNIVFASTPEMVTDFSFATDFYSEGDDLSGASKQWKYMYNDNKTENDDGSYSNYKDYVEITDWVAEGSSGYWNIANGRVCEGGVIYSVSHCRVGVVWIAPMSGTISISVNSGEFGRVSSFASELDTDADIVTRIAKSDQSGGSAVELERVLLPAEPAYYYKTNTSLPKNLKIDVVAGDKIYFECHGTGSVRREIVWNPIITYEVATQCYADDGTLITEETELESGMNINYVLYKNDSYGATAPMCLALYDSKNRLSAVSLKDVAEQENKYVLNVIVPSLLNTSEEVEEDYSGWSVGLTVMSDTTVFTPIYVSNKLVLN